MTAPSLLALASAANEALIGYTEAIDTRIEHGCLVSTAKAVRNARVDLLKAVNDLTSAVVEAENERPERPVLDELMTPRQLAEYLSTTVGALSQQRYLGVGPPYLRAGKLIRYRVKDVAAYLETGTQPLSDERDRLADEVVGLREANRILLARQPGEQRRGARREVAARHLVEDGDDEDQKRFKQSYREWRATLS